MLFIYWFLEYISDFYNCLFCWHTKRQNHIRNRVGQGGDYLHDVPPDDLCIGKLPHGHDVLLQCCLRPHIVEVIGIYIYDYDGGYSRITVIVVISGVCERWAYPALPVTPAMCVAISAVNSVVCFQTDVQKYYQKHVSHHFG